MKRFHVHVAVPDLEASIRFYSTLFAAAPTVRKDDYAKWMLDDPRVNFAISARGGDGGINHLGFQVESADELDAMEAQLLAADQSLVAEEKTACCYALSDKYWITDPAGIAWETFHTLSSIPVFGSAAAAPAEPSPTGCGCGPSAAAAPPEAARSGCGCGPSATAGAKACCA